MRITRMRAAAAGVLGAALIAVAPPASATSTSTPTAPATTAAASASATPAADLPDATTVPSGTPTADATETPEADASASATPTEGATADPSTGASATATDGASPTSTPTEGTGDPILDGFLSLLPFKVPLDKEINGIEDFDANPFLLSHTCGGAGPEWTLRNTADKAFGYGWFDTSLGAGISEIGPGETQSLNTHGMAVVIAPWDAETGYLLVTLPTVGMSECEGTAPPAAAPIALPIASPAAASAVKAEPYYTG